MITQLNKNELIKIFTDKINNINNYQDTINKLLNKRLNLDINNNDKLIKHYYEIISKNNNIINHLNEMLLRNDYNELLNYYEEYF